LSTATARLHLDAAALCEERGYHEAFRRHIAWARAWSKRSDDLTVQYAVAVASAHVAAGMNGDAVVVAYDLGLAWELRRNEAVTPDPSLVATEVLLAGRRGRREQVETTVRACLAGVQVDDDRFGGDVLRILGADALIELGLADVAARWCALRAEAASRALLAADVPVRRVIHAAEVIVALREAEAILDIDPDDRERVHTRAEALRTAVRGEIDPIIRDVSDAIERRYTAHGIGALGHETEAIAEVVGQFYSPRSAGPWWVKAANVHAFEAERLPSPSTARSTAFRESRRCYERAARAFDQSSETRKFAVVARESAHRAHLGRSTGFGL
jgi:hypothetical protein